MKLPKRVGAERVRAVGSVKLNNVATINDTYAVCIQFFSPSCMTESLFGLQPNFGMPNTTFVFVYLSPNFYCSNFDHTFFSAKDF